VRSSPGHRFLLSVAVRKLQWAFLLPTLACPLPMLQIQQETNPDPSAHLLPRLSVERYNNRHIPDINGVLA